MQTRPGPRAIPAQFVLALALVANITAQAFLFVSLPALGRRMGFSDIETGAILSLSALVLIVAAPAWGHLSERIGRRPVILMALSGAGLGPLAYALITDARLDGAVGAGAALGLFFAARSAQALLIAGLLPSVQAYIADVTSAQQRVGGMGLVGAAYGLGVIGGALLAWRVGGSDPVTAFLITAGFVAFAFTLVLAAVPEPVRHASAEPEASTAGLVGRIWPFAAITLLAYCAYGIVQQVLSLRLQDAMGFGSEDSIAKAGVGMLAMALAMVLVQGLLVRVLAWQPERLLLCGALLGAGAMALCGLARSYEETFAVLLLFGVALGLMLPGNLAALSLRAGVAAQGRAAGVNMMGQGLGLAIGPLSGAALHQLGLGLPFIAATALLAGSSVLAVIGSRVPRSRDRPAA